MSELNNSDGVTHAYEEKARHLRDSSECGVPSSKVVAFGHDGKIGFLFQASLQGQRGVFAHNVRCYSEYPSGTH